VRRSIAISWMRIAIVALPITSCFGAADYHCSSDDECQWGDRQGVCEASTDYCSYPDGDCPSGAKYSDQAGDLSGRCVDGPPTDDDGSSSSSSTSGESTTTSTGGDSTTDIPQPVCGNAVPEAGEPCDDGNDVDGDGCNVDCMLSGSPRWEPPVRVHVAGEGGDARFWDVDVRPDDTIIAVGLEDVFDQDALFVLWSGDGEVVWARQYDRGMGSDIARAVSSAVGSEIYVAGESTEPPSPGGWISLVEPADGDVEITTPTERTWAVGMAHMHPARLVVAGYGSGFVGARAFTDMVLPAWVAEAAITPGSMSAVAADGVRDIAYGAGNFDGVARVMQFAPGEVEPVVTLYDGPAGSGAQSLEFGDGALALGGYLGVGMRDGWVQRLSASGAELWSWSTAQDGEEEVEDVAIAPSGHVVAVGFTTELAQDVAVWKLSPDGELVWTWTWDEPLANDDIARGVAVRPDGDIVVVGALTKDDGTSDGWVVRLTP
jgi:cysteine-rich repeat protein